jgi:dTDP-4-dehydrorhamnose reductase
MRVVIFGASGQLGRALHAKLPPGVEALALQRPEIDFANPRAIETFVTNVQADVFINAAAYTAVDKAEVEVDQAYLINAKSVAAIARGVERQGARLLHVSTDYVFDGTKGRPYLPGDDATPVNIYGKSKLEGERLALESCHNTLVVRTAWLYGNDGANFVRTMLRLMRTREEIKVVGDQVGSPTYASSLADALWKLAFSSAVGVLHYTDSGVASWYDFACAIHDEALALGLLEKKVTIIPIATAEYPAPARRPSFGILDKTATDALLGQSANHWRHNLRLMLKGISSNA